MLPPSPGTWRSKFPIAVPALPPNNRSTSSSHSSRRKRPATGWAWRYPANWRKAWERNFSGGTRPPRAPLLSCNSGGTMHSNGTVLIAEDERTARLSLSELLEGRGYRVMEAEDGPQALTALMRNPQSIDAGLLDIRMPGLDGLSILQRARESGI